MENNEIDVVFVPWYIKSSMDANKVGMNLLTNGLENYRKGIPTNIERIPKADLDDLIVINEFLNRYFFVNSVGKTELSRTLFKLANKFDVPLAAKEIIDVLSSNDNSDFKKTFILTYENNTLYVVLNEGFSNFIKFNNKESKKVLFHELINFAFKYFKTIDIYDSRYFKNFLILGNKQK